MRQIWRIVTTDDENGKSGVLVDGIVSNTTAVLTELWITDSKQPNHKDRLTMPSGPLNSSLRPLGLCFDTSTSRLN